MNQETFKSQVGPDAIDIYLLRNEFLDAFAELETAVFRVLHSCAKPATSEPFSQRVKAFRTAEKTGLIAKANLSQRDQIADGIVNLLTVRADIVHSVMKISNVDGCDTAIFVNAREASADFPLARSLTVNDLRDLIQKVKQLNNQIANLRSVNPPSSQPPPSPGAAGVP